MFENRIPELPDLDGFRLDPGEFDLPSRRWRFEVASGDVGALSWLGIGPNAIRYLAAHNMLWLRPALAVDPAICGDGPCSARHCQPFLRPSAPSRAILSPACFARFRACWLPKTETSSMSERGP